MSLQSTGIHYLDAVWNPVRGCSHCGPECQNCWSERIAQRFCRGRKQRIGEDRTAEDGAFRLADGPFAGFANELGWTGRVELMVTKLDEPLRARKPQRIGVCFTSDLFHESLPDEAIDRVFAVMAICHWHTFVVLTKRSKRMYDWFIHPHRWDFVQLACAELSGRSGKYLYGDFPPWPRPNVWLGVTAWDQPSLDRSVAFLSMTTAAKRWISLEPLLSPVRFADNLRALDWVVAGCESGPGRRPAHTQWFRDLKNQCAAGVPFYLKQMSVENANGKEEVVEHPYLDGRQWMDMPEVKR